MSGAIKLPNLFWKKKNVHREVSSKSGWQMPSPCVRSESRFLLDASNVISVYL